MIISEYIKKLELLVQAYRTSMDLCILCGGDLDEDHDKEAMICSECVKHAKIGDQLKLKELK